MNATAPDGGQERDRRRVRSADFLTKYTEKDQDQNLTHIFAIFFF